MTAPTQGLDAQQIPPSGDVALTHATVIDPAGGTIHPDTTVTVRGPRIAEVGPAADVAVPSDARVVDATGRYVIPGLWDMHVHTFDDHALPLFLYNGVTGIRHMGGAPPHTRWRDELRAGELLAPRMVVASPIIDGPQPLRPGSIAVGTPEEARAAVRSSREGGADFLKVYNLLPRDAYFALVDEARVLGMPFSGHVPFGVTVEEASQAGQASVEHLEGVLFASSGRRAELEERLHRVDPTDMAAVHSVFGRMEPEAADSHAPDLADALYRSFAANGTWHVPTLAVLQAAAHAGGDDFPLRPYLRYVEPWLRDMWRQAGQWMGSPEDRERQERLFRQKVSVVGEMHRAGVELMAGTDTFVPGFSLHDELALLVRAGLPPMEALRAATHQPARYLGATGDFGAVAEGAVADLVVLDSDPLADIHTTRAIHGLVLGGTYHDRADLDGMLATFESRTADAADTGE